MTMTDPGDLKQDDAADRTTAKDAHGAKGLSPSEQAELGKIEAGLKDKGDGSMAGSAPHAKVQKQGATGSSKADGGKAGSSLASSGGVGGAVGRGITNAIKNTARSDYASKHKGPLMAGGAVGLILAAVLASFVALLPLKLESMMQNIFEKRVGNRIEYYIEKRAQTMVEKYLESSVGRSDSQFEKSIVSTGQPLRDLYRTWRVRKFEADLEKHQGVRFQRNPDGTIDVFQDGELVGNMTKPEAIGVFNDAIKSETEWWQFYKRMHLRTWMKEAYGITKWDFYKNIIDKIKCSVTSCTDDEAATKEVLDNSVSDAAVPAAEAETLDVGCAVTTGEQTCINDPNDPEAPGMDGQGLTTSDSKPANDGNTAEGDIQNAATTAEQDAVTQTESDVAKQGASITERVLAAILPNTIAKAITTVMDASAGPLIIVSVVDIASHIDHFLWTGGADKAIAGAHEVEYATEFAQWLTMADQWKSGQNISGDELNATMNLLKGIENAASFQQIYGTGTGGQELDTTGTGANTTGNPMARSIDRNYHPIQSFYQIIASVPQPTLNGLPLHTALTLWYDSIGKIWGWINNIIGQLLGWTLDALMFIFKYTNPPLYDIMHFLLGNGGKLAAGVITHLIGLLIIPAVDGTEIGADLINGLDAGAVVTGIGFARDVGAPIISLLGAQKLDSEIAAQQAQQASQLSIATRLFSPSYSHSLVNNVAFAMPSTPSGALDDSANYAASILANPMHMFASIPSMLGLVDSANAASTQPGDSPQNLYGMQDYAYTDAQLGVDDTTQLDAAWQTATTRLGHTPTYGDLDVTDCPKVANPDADPNVCRLDIVTLQSLGAKYTSSTSLDGGID